MNAGLNIAEGELNENLGADNVALLKQGAALIGDNTDASGKLDKKALVKSASSTLLKFGANKLIESVSGDTSPSGNTILPSFGGGAANGNSNTQNNQGMPTMQGVATFAAGKALTSLFGGDNGAADTSASQDNGVPTLEGVATLAAGKALSSLFGNKS